MVETIEIEDEAVIMMLETLREEHGEEVVENDIQSAIRKSVASGYAQL